jgi:MoaA/NifB/PqqE/SkfB family radical SAM enzyme
MTVINTLRVITQLSRNLLKGRISGYKPFFLSHLITSKCNFKCEQCLWNESSAPDLTIGEIRSLYDQARACGFVANYLWGGEPLIRKDIDEIVRYSKEKGMINFINTNAWFLKEKIPSIAPYVDVIIISLNGSTAELHDKTCGVKGSFDRILEAINILNTQYPKIPIIINTLILKHNFHDIDNIIDLWKKMGVSGYVNFIEMDLLKSSGMGSQNVDFDASEATRRELAKMLISRKKGKAPILNTYNYFNTFVEGKKPYRCHFPKIFLEVYADGSVLDCVNVDKPIGNVKGQPLQSILQHPRIQGMIDDGEKWCCVHNNADRIDASNTWELHRESITTGLRFLLGRNR